MSRRALHSATLLGMRPVVVLAIAAWLGGAVHAQEAPVTRAEALQAFFRYERALDLTLGLPEPKAPAPGGSQSFTRQDFLREADRLFRKYKPHFKVTPRPVRPNAAALQQGLPEELRGTARTMVRWGAVAPVGLVVVGPQDTFTVPQFGDALGFFFTRVVGLTHMPDQRWTPWLRHDEL